MLPKTLASVLALAAAIPLGGPQVFRGGVDHVAVDVVVTDAGGRPIADLTAADFAIREAGRVQQIADFRLVSLAPPPLAPVGPPAGPPVLRDVETNAPASRDSRLFVILVDDLHLLTSEIVPVKEQVRRFLSRCSPDDDVALVFVGHSNLSVNFTRDRARLLAALDRAREAFGFGLDPVEQVGQLGGVDFARTAATELRLIARALAGSDHARRAIVYISDGVSFDPGAPLRSAERDSARNIYEDLRDAFAAARRWDVPIYTLDPRGLVTPETAVKGWGPRTPDARQEVMRRVHLQQDYLATVALNTGGLAFFNQSNPARAIDAIVADNSAFYVLGYYPHPFVRDGQFHPIRVSVDRPGAVVRARAGYVAPADRPATATTRQALDDALSSALNVSGLMLRGLATPIAVHGDRTTIWTAVDLDYPSQAGARIHDTVRLAVYGLDADGRVQSTSDHAFAFAGSPHAAGDAPMRLDDVVDVPASVAVVRIAVASDALGTAGSLSVPVVPLKTGRSSVTLGGIVIGYAGPPRLPALHAEAGVAPAPFQPTTRRAFVSTDTLRVFARLSGREAAGATTTLRVRHDTAVAKTVGLSAEPAPAVQGALDLDATVPLVGLAAGSYVLELGVQPAHGDTVVRAVPFTIR
jgi:VWFA-related protein